MSGNFGCQTFSGCVVVQHYLKSIVVQDLELHANSLDKHWRENQHSCFSNDHTSCSHELGYITSVLKWNCNHIVYVVALVSERR